MIDYTKAKARYYFLSKCIIFYFGQVLRSALRERCWMFFFFVGIPQGSGPRQDYQKCMNDCGGNNGLGMFDLMEALTLPKSSETQFGVVDYKSFHVRTCICIGLFYSNLQ